MKKPQEGQPPRHAGSQYLPIVLCVAGLAIGGEAMATASLPATNAIAWDTCAPGFVDERWRVALGHRLQCGSMHAVLDEDAPDGRTFTVGIVRVKAGDPARRKGSIFFNFGGPGGNPLDYLPPMAYLWTILDLDHPLDGDKRRLADGYDLVAVVPRGMRGGTRITCHGLPEARPSEDPTFFLADFNWARIVQAARTYANGCTEDPLQRHAGTLQHVRDMEQVRRALGEPAMNFVGVSYGSWVGAFYAAAYPGHTGRIVLDSVMNYAGTFQDQIEDASYDNQWRFAWRALRPALAQPHRYGIGTDAKAVMRQFNAMPILAGASWAPVIDAPSHLVAALVMAEWVRAEWNTTADRLVARANAHVFSADRGAHEEIKQAALELAERYDQARDETLGGLVDLAVFHAVVCGDTPWRKDIHAMRALAQDIGSRYPAAGGRGVRLSLVCANWTNGPRWRPPVYALSLAPPMLMVQAEFDPSTSLDGAMKAFNASANAYLVVAKGMTGHGIFGSSATPCVEQGVSRYLLTGKLPDSALSYCDFVPAPPVRESREAHDGPSESEARAEFARLIRAS